MPPPSAALLAYVVVLGLLAVHGLHRLTQLSWLARGSGVRPGAAREPSVTVHLPLFEERLVAARVVEAVGALDWPREKFEVVVLDDSRDDTTAIAQAAVAKLVARGVRASLRHRDHRDGYKAGALRDAFADVKTEWIALFDADFVPAPDWLRRVSGHLQHDVDVVQTRWGHLNAADGVLTAAQSVLLDGHFANEHAARQAAGLWFNFNGTAGLWRAEAIRRAGGWQPRTVVEDLDLSYRGHLVGLRFRYVHDVVAPAELPPDLRSFLAQQRRWALGTTQAARLLLAPIWRSPASLATKLEATSHLTAPSSWPLVVLLALLLPPAVHARLDGDLPALAVIDFALFGAALAPFLVWYVVAVLRTGGRWRLWYLPAVFALGLGISVAQSRAFFAGLRGDRIAFSRTPKRGNQPRSGYSADRHAGWTEVALACWTLLALGPVLEHGEWAALPFVLLFASGLAWVGLGALTGPGRPPKHAS